MTRTGALVFAVGVATACASAPAKSPAPAAAKGEPNAAPSASSAACPIPSLLYEPLRKSEVSVSLPPTPVLPERPVRVGDAYTVWGASMSLRSNVKRSEVMGKEITVQGIIVKTNLTTAPSCAVHATGIADPEDCSAPIPTFWLADEAGAPVANAIRVMGWASNYANVFDAIRVYDSSTGGSYDDVYWGQRLPNPLPAVGAKVTVTGVYGTSFAKASSGSETDARMGILDYRSLEVLEPARELATLPGVRRKSR